MISLQMIMSMKGASPAWVNLYRFHLIFQVQVKCGLTYMDFEGRSDGRSVKSILAHVAPLKLVCNSSFISNFFLVYYKFSIY